MPEGFLLRISINIQPTDHISIAEVYSEQLSNNSGARYQRVTTYSVIKSVSEISVQNFSRMYIFKQLTIILSSPQAPTTNIRSLIYKEIKSGKNSRTQNREEIYWEKPSLIFA
ncbi:hypothetical protein ACJIZ3_012624 [Penstemon smallii]|uniref:Uncharacterized protein n=1 Tax=Penstemon smallii TaxID=265156 RepID=A0ABD3UML0_9LAMI